MTSPGIIEKTDIDGSLPLTPPRYLWSDQEAAGMTEQELLLYRSNILGGDLVVTNFGGGNTSAKVTMADPLTGEEVVILWVKGSGGDLGSMKLDGFATLYLDKLRMLEAKYRGLEHEDEMVSYLPHCTFDLNPRAASIDTPLHTFLPFKHVDHMHPDAVIAIAAARNSRALTEEIFNGEMGWLPWQRPGFDLGLRLREELEENPGIRGILLESHGLFTWGETSKECYDNTFEVIRRTTEYINERLNGKAAFGGQTRICLSEANRFDRFAGLMPEIRARISRETPKIGHINQAPEVLEFVCSGRLQELSEIGTSCPDHFLRTKIRPLVVEPDKALADDGGEYLDMLLGEYRDFYAAYYNRCRHDDSPAMRDANPVVYLLPGLGDDDFRRGQENRAHRRRILPERNQRHARDHRPVRIRGPG